MELLRYMAKQMLELNERALSSDFFKLYIIAEKCYYSYIVLPKKIRCILTTCATLHTHTWPDTAASRNARGHPDLCVG
jgi:hypothetical protein